MKKTMINIKTDKAVKEQAQAVVRDLGLTLSAFVTASLKDLIRTREIHFTAAPKMTPYLERIIARAEKDLKTGKNMSPVFTNAKDMLDYLHSHSK